MSLGFFTTRWAACKNVGNCRIYHNSIVEIVDIEAGDGHPMSSRVVFHVDMPSKNNASPIGVVGPGNIPVGGRGYVIFDGVATVQASTTIGSTTNLGSTADSFYALPDGIGMRVLAAEDDYAFVSLSGPDLANLPVENTPDYVIALDSNGCLCKTPVNTC